MLLGYETFITGMACRLPGASSVKALSRALYSKSDLVTSIPEERWAHHAFLASAPVAAGKSYTFSAGVLDDIWGFDSAAFGISPREAAQMDPQQRILLQVAHEALEDAGLPRDRLAGSQVGVYVGASTMTHATRMSHDPLAGDAYLMTGNTLSLVSNRISHNFDFGGPSLTVDTACSSSLFAFDLAVKALLRDEIDTAIVAGTNLLLDPMHFAGFSAAKMLSPTGRCRPFSSNADGYVRAEGVVAFVLERKTLPDIEPRRPRAKILAVGTNSDGRTLNTALPSEDGQARLLNDVYEAAAVNPASLAFVEAHGTGTQVGDPIEALALGRVLGQGRARPLPIGSIKSNIGHLEPASGAAGLLKSLIAFENGVCPATLHLETPNPNIDFEDLNLELMTEGFQLTTDSAQPYRAGISSFGFGGANAHMVIESAPDVSVQQKTNPVSRPVLVLSAATQDSLHDLLCDWQKKIQSEKPELQELGDLAGQVHTFRSLDNHRAAVLVDDAESTQEAFQKIAKGHKHSHVLTGKSSLHAEPTVFVFSGNGSQYNGMSQLALKTDATYARKMHEIDAIFSGFSGWSIQERLASDDFDEAIRNCDVAQPLLFADQVSQIAAFGDRGLTPAAVMGHSGGEVAAAHVAGALSLTQALELIYSRSISQRKLRGLGTMAALQVSAEEARQSLVEFGGNLHIAAENSPNSVTLVGDGDAISDYIQFARRTRRWACVKLDINYPYHSPMQDGIMDELRAAISEIRPAKTNLPFVSSVTGNLEEGDELDPEYWCANVRSPVCFRSAMETLQNLGYRAFLEIGSMPVLLNYMKASIGDGLPNAVVIQGFEKMDSIDPVGRTIARAAVNGCGVSIRDLAPTPTQFNRTLPRYRWTNKSYRADETRNVNRSYGGDPNYHRLLGLEQSDGNASWKTDLDIGYFSELADHMVGGQVLMPATGFAEISLAAAQRALSTDAVELRDFDIAAPLRLNAGVLSTLHTRADPTTATVQLKSQLRVSDSEWRVQTRSRMYRLEEPPISGAAPDISRLDGDIPGEKIYEAARYIGLEYGPLFRRLSHMRQNDKDNFEVILNTAEPLPLGHKDVVVHAFDLVGADAVFHGLIGILPDLRGDRTGYLPVRIGRLALLVSGAAIRSGNIKIRRIGHRSLVADFVMFGHDNKPIAILDGVRFQAARLKRTIDLDHHAYRMKPRKISATVPPYSARIDDILARANLPEFSPGDEGVFLLEGISHQIALSAARSLADTDNFVAIPAAGASKYFLGLMGILSRSGLAKKSDAGWVLIAEQHDMDAPHTLIASLLKRRPDLGSQAVLLSRLSSSFGTLLTKPPASAAAAFGRDALSQYEQGNVHSARATQLLVAHALSVVELSSKNAAIRILEVSDGTARLLPTMIDIPAFEGVSFSEFVLDQGETGKGSTMLPPEKVKQLNNIATPERFDLLLVPDQITGSSQNEELITKLTGLLAQGGQLLAVYASPSDFLDLAYGFNDDWYNGFDTEGYPIARLHIPGSLENLIFEGSTNTHAVAELPIGFGMTNLLLIEASSSAIPPQTSASDLAMRLDALMSDEEHEDVNVLPKAGMRVATAKSTDQATLLYFQSELNGLDPVELLTERLIALRDLSEKLNKLPSKIIAVVPGGSGQSLARQAEPVQTAVWDCLRVLVNECGNLQRQAIDLASELDSKEAATRIAGFLKSRQNQPEETEIVITSKGIHGLHVERGSFECDTVMRDRAVLSLPLTGGLDDLKWVASDRVPPGPGEVEIEVVSTGLNFRDVMWAMGILPEEALEKGFVGPTLGMEFSGRIVRVGEGADDFEIGDAVMAFGPASFASHCTLSRDLVARVPNGMELEAAAALPVAFFTAYYSLIHLAKLSKNETVLIHAGAGGVGLAAIQVAQSVGAKIIATAGTDTKRDFLKVLGVKDVLESRSQSFADKVMELTGGKGVDVVLNSLAGDSMEKSLNCLAPFGRFLELGKQDFYSNTAVGLRPMKENIAYFGIDVDQLIAAHPSVSNRIFKKVTQRFEEGAFHPIPYRVFDSSNVVDAFRVLQKSGHVGKIVIRPSAPAGLQATSNPSQQFKASPDGAHVIIGGTGGVGLKVAEWLVRCGAKILVLMSRSGTINSSTRIEIDKWRAMGVIVQIEVCDVADKAALKKSLDDLRAEFSLKGIIHSAMMLDDKPVSALTKESLPRTLTAKVTGSVNLDQLTRGDALDYFVMFSSIAAMIGNHGQSAYVAANGFLEGLARRRRDEGLPAFAIGWGAVSDAGYLARSAQNEKIVKRMTGDVAFTSDDLTDALGQLLVRADNLDPVQYVSNMRWGNAAKALRVLSEPAYRVLKVLGEQVVSELGGGDLREELLNLSPKKAKARLSSVLCNRISVILRVPEKSIDMVVPISELGVDSLMGVELGMNLEEILGSEIPPSFVSDSQSVSQIAQKMVDFIQSNDDDTFFAEDSSNDLMKRHISLETQQTKAALEKVKG